MGLINKTAAAFETDTDAAPTATVAASPAPAAQADKLTATAPATQASAAVAVVKPANTAVAIAQHMEKLTAYRDALHVDYNTLDQIIATNGNFVDRESKKVLGDTVVFELLSYQDSYVVSPEDDDAPNDVVRYSDDGVTCSDGTDVQEHLVWLKANGYPKARLKQRVVVVGGVESAAKSADFNDKLVQFDVAPSSRVQWQRYLANTAYLMKKGTLVAGDSQRIKVEAVLSNSSNNDTFTLMKFTAA